LEVADSKQRFEAEDLAKLKVAIVHYWLVTWRGGEKVLQSMLKLFPQADIYTLFYNPETCDHYLKGHNIYSSGLDYPLTRKHFRKLYPLYPLGIKSLKLRKGYDLLISSESGPAKGIANPEQIPHLCYIHTPMRYCWSERRQYVQAVPALFRGVADKAFEKLKRWDKTTVENVDYYIANSRNVARRVQKFYQRKADVCYPPIALDLFEERLKTEERVHFLSFGALTPYKKIELLVDTFNQNGLPLVIIGEGSEKGRLESRAKGNIRFSGRLPQAEILSLVNRSRALLFPGEEDFGMIPLEVMSQGVPVIAYNRGGALETVVADADHPEHSSGLFFSEQNVKSLNRALHQFENIEKKFDPQWIRSHARKFGEDHFQSQFSQYVLNFLNRATRC
jgi:glycosyltransferase involved in cell wall biosynthesis